MREAILQNVVDVLSDRSSFLEFMYRVSSERIYQEALKMSVWTKLNNIKQIHEEMAEKFVGTYIEVSEV